VIGEDIDLVILILSKSSHKCIHLSVCNVRYPELLRRLHQIIPGVIEAAENGYMLISEPACH